MADEHLRLDSHKIRGTDETWWYEEPHGITVVHQIHINGVLNRTDQIKIPWRSLRNALARKDAAPTTGTSVPKEKE